MSTTVMSAVFKHSESRGSARLMLLAMADEAADTGELTAYRRSQSWLARKANVSRTSAKDAIAALVELGELQIVRVGVGRESSDYRIVLPGIEGAEIRPSAESGPQRAENRPSEGRNLALRGPKSGPPSSRSLPVHPVSPTRADEPEPLQPALVAVPDEPLPHRQNAERLLAQERFEKWWNAYPKRDGKRVGRGKCLALWLKLTAREHEAAWVGVNHYAASGWRPKDPERWLRDRLWEDWQEPARHDAPAAANGDRPARVGYTGQNLRWD